MRTIMLLLFLSLNLALTAQNYDFGKVSKEEIEEKFNPLDSSASATYLYKYRHTYFKYYQENGYVQVTDVHARIKIYNKEGFDYATKVINLYKNGSEQEDVNGLKAYTYNLVNGNIEETTLGKDAIFNSEESKFHDQKKFTMPNIKEGSVIEFKYSVNSPFISNVDEFVFQHDIPIKKIKAVFDAPEYFNFKVNTKGFLAIDRKTETKPDKIIFNYKERSDGGGFSTTTTSFKSSEVNFVKSIHTYNLSDIPALKEEPYVNSIYNYSSGVKYELSYTKFPQSTIKYYSTTWDDVVKTIYQNPNFGNELDKTGYYENEIMALTHSISNPIEKAMLIFDFVKSKLKWNGYYGKNCNDGVKKAYKDQTGNVAEINLMLTSMLRFAGLNANPVLVSSRNNGIPLFPTLDGYNYVISAIETPEGTILLDATSKYSTPNILPFRTLNWEGRIIRKDKSSSTLSLYPKSKSKNLMIMLANLNSSGRLEGSIRTTKTDHSAMSYREEYVEVDKNQFLEKLENKYNGIEILDLEVKNDSDVSKPIVEDYKFIKESQVDVIGEKIYFSPLFFLKTVENPFKLEKREFPVDFGFPSENKYMITLILPEGYKLEALPQSYSFALPDNLAIYKYNILQAGNTIQLIITAEINQPIIGPYYYDALKAYFSKIIELEGEQIVLTKI